MILEFKIKNFLSFKDEVTYSFEATKDKNLEEYYVTEVVPGVRLLKLGSVYGANASGKSNLISAFELLSFLVGKVRTDKEEPTSFVPFMFGETKDQPGKLELVFYARNKDEVFQKYVYSIVIDTHVIREETLQFYPGTQPATIYKRTYDDESKTSKIEFGSKIKVSKQAKEEILLKTLKNMTVLAALKQVNYAIEEVETVIVWFHNHILELVEPHTRLTEYIIDNVEKDSELKNFVMESLSEAYFNVSDLRVKEEFQKVPEDFLRMVEASGMPQEEKNEIIKEKGFIQNKVEFEHSITDNGRKEKYFLPIELESKGTIRYLGLTAPFYEMYKNNAFLTIDEIESSMHALLANHILAEYLKKGRKAPCAQLLVTTHNISLLNEKDLIRKDAVWFTNKQENGATELYSLSTFDIRKELSYYNAYKNGKFGAIPNVD
jgi:AAA15 family ATPase/GTPase